MVEILTGPRLARALRAGALAVVREQELLNRINVFPVPDADTGTNLASTLRAAAAALTLPPVLGVGQTARLAADAALDGARGNSGAILAQFLHGLADGMGSRLHLGVREFSAAVRRGVDAAQQALVQPVDGTILSVLQAWGTAIEEHARQVSDFGELLGRSLERARIALADTPRQLAVLARHNVVDAGAQGFVFFLEGISTFIGDRRAAGWRQSGLSLAPTTPFAAAHAEIDTSYRYCAEGLLVGEHIDRKAIAAAVAPLGASLVVAGGGSRLRVHLHTNEPQRLYALLAGFGRLERTKLDDMVQQQLGERPVALVTDSSCDLPEATAHALRLVRVPLALSFGDERFIDGVDITPPQFYQRLLSSPHPPRTSQPAVGDFRRTFERLLESHQSVLCLTLSSGLSGTYQAAEAAAALVDGARVRVVDTRHLSITLGLVAEAVGEALAAGAAVAEAAALAERVSRRVFLFSTFPSLDTLVKGGRVGPAGARLARLLAIKPVIGLDAAGRAQRLGVSIGYAAALRSLARRAARQAAGRPVRLLIAHANAIGAATYVAEEAARRTGVTDVPIVNLAPALAAHTGVGGVGLAVRVLEVNE